MSAEELATFAPWTVAAIEKMVRRGVLRSGVHWFQPFGRRSQRIFKRRAIVELIEGGGAGSKAGVREANAKRTDVEKATEELQRLLG